MPSDCSDSILEAAHRPQCSKIPVKRLIKPWKHGDPAGSVRKHMQLTDVCGSGAYQDTAQFPDTEMVYLPSLT